MSVDFDKSINVAKFYLEKNFKIFVLILTVKSLFNLVKASGLTIEGDAKKDLSEIITDKS